MVRDATPSDASSICEIYNHYVLHTHSTFEMDPISEQEMAKRVSHVQNELKLPWLIFEMKDQIMGYAYATQWKPRKAYARTVESTVYLSPDSFGKGIGSIIYRELLDQLVALDYHSILGGIALPNDASIGLHEKLGFVKVGQLKEVGFKMNRWVDVGYWEYRVDN